MPALTTRQAARERVLQMALAAVDRMFPADERQSLKGSTFADFEQQAYAVGNEVLGAFIEERAKLESNARVEVAGRCPYCQSERTHLDEEVRQQEIRSPSGPIVYAKQNGRCRACGGSFSPSGAGLGAADRRGLDALGCAPRGTGSGPEHRR